MQNRSKKQNVTIQQILTALLDDQNIFPPAYLRQFSDLEGADLQALRSVWPQVSPQRRFNLLEDLEDLAEVDTLVSFDNVASMALDDSDPRVRTVAVRLLWESENPRLASRFLKMMTEDVDTAVRAAAATALGLFVYLGELEEIPEELLHRVEEHLLRVTTGGDDSLVRRRALEALGYSGRKEVPALIRQAYSNEDNDWLASALFAMGRSADATWAPEILRMLRHPNTNIQLEAVRAAGELELDAARRPLLQMLAEDMQDNDLRQAIIWSLSKIGGEDVRETLEALLDETEDDEEIEFLETALDSLSFTEDADPFNMFDFDKLDEMEEVDLSADESWLDDDGEEPSGSDQGANGRRKRHRKP